jgi:cobalt-zinc-cadmium efflux system protein
MADPHHEHSGRHDRVQVEPRHGHSHGHAGHSHGASADADFGKLAIALFLVVGFMGAEIVVGILASSLALLSDAAHMLTDDARS